MRSIETSLDKVLTLRLGHEWLQLGSGESVHKTRLGDDEQQHLSASKGRQFVCLPKTDKDLG